MHTISCALREAFIIIKQNDNTLFLRRVNCKIRKDPTKIWDVSHARRQIYKLFWLFA